MNEQEEAARELEGDLDRLRRTSEAVIFYNQSKARYWHRLGSAIPWLVLLLIGWSAFVWVR